MGSWQTLFATQAGVGAALTGLVFVALSINLKQILALPSLADRAGEALLLLLLPVINGLVGVLPQTSSRALGGELLGIATVLWVIVSRILLTGHKAALGRPAHEFVTRALAAQFAVVPAIVAGCLLLVGNSSGGPVVAGRGQAAVHRRRCRRCLGPIGEDSPVTPRVKLRPVQEW
jgi:modulator of FtsH protease